MIQKTRMKKSVIRTKTIKKLRDFSEYLKTKSDYLENLDLLTKGDYKVISHNKKFKNCHKNKRAFIIANGSSLNNQNIKPLANEITFVMNGFHKHPSSNIIDPNYYSIVDSAHFKNITDTQEFYSLINKNCKNSNFFITLSRGYDFNTKYEVLPSEQTNYVAIYGKPREISLDFTKLMPSYGTVAAFSLAMAIYMGCNPIYLLGFDHDYLANRDIDKHFYKGNDGLKGEIGLRNETKPLSEIYSYHKTMKFMTLFWDSYISLKKIANKKGIKIYNATDGGFLDVFDRINYEEVLGIEIVKKKS